MGLNVTGWTHQAYFRKFRLNVEQYGEILVAEAFQGLKKGDAQPCYDVEASEARVREVLQAYDIPLSRIDACLRGQVGKKIRIEVKSKLARTSSGRANVIHCSRNKLRGVRGHEPATHFAVILFGGDQSDDAAEDAWLFAVDVAESLRRKNTDSGYIPVPALRCAGAAHQGLVHICKIINDIAGRELEMTMGDSKVAQQSAPPDAAARRE